MTQQPLTIEPHRVVCDFCGADDKPMGTPEGYSKAFGPCCADCAGKTSKQRVATWGARMQNRFEGRSR